MRNMVLIGGGGHCKSVLDTILRTELYDRIVITDPGLRKHSLILGVEVVGDDTELQSLYNRGFNYAFITIGALMNPQVRINLNDRARDIGFRLPVIVDPSAVVSKYTKIGDGTFIGKNAIINTDSSIGTNCIINSGAIIEHECSIGEYSHISVGTVLCGDVHVGDNCLIGAGSVIKEGIYIGNNSIVGIGSTVIENLDANITAYGLIK